MDHTLQIELTGITVAELLRRWPQTVPVFLRRRLACVGCPMATFEDLLDVPRVYGIDATNFLADLRQALAAEETKP